MKTFKISSLIFFLLTSCGSAIGSDLSQDLQFSVSPVDEQTVGDQHIVSSTKLDLAWSKLDIDHYELNVLELTSNTTETITIDGNEDSYLLTDLKASTEYLLSLHACQNAACAEVLAQDAVQVKTQEEYWQIQGEGHEFTTARQLFEGGNTVAYVMQVGDELTLYGSSRPDSVGTIGPEAHTRTASDKIEDYFDWEDHGFVLEDECKVSKPNEERESCPEGDMHFYATQQVPLAQKETVLFCYEGHESDPEKITQIYCLESHDGYTGLDFNADPDRTICGDQKGDYSKGGPCEVTKISRDFGLVNARQFKIGFPKRDTDFWDQAPGTFMIITGEDECGQTQNGLFYAQWDGEAWQVTKDEQGCAIPMVTYAHGPILVHLGEERYKLYYEEADLSGGLSYQDAMNNGKPLHMIYTDGLDFDDWEGQDLGREVHFLWPDGTMLSAPEEAGLGDHMILLPTNDLDFQLMVTNLNGLDNSGDSGPSEGLGLAVLLNP